MTRVAWILAASCAFSALMLAVGRVDDHITATFVALAVMTAIVITAIALTRTKRVSCLRPVRKVLVLSALALVACGVLVAETLFVALIFAWPAGQRVDGDFVVKGWRSVDIIGEPNPGTHVLYFRGKQVTDYLLAYVHHPTRPAVIIYENYGHDGPGATYAFNGETFRTLRLGPPYGLPGADRWSPDGTKAVLELYDGLYLFDLSRWRVTRLIGIPVPPEEPHSMDLAGWSPGSRCFAAIENLGRSESGWPTRVLLREWDADTLTSRTLGCAADEGPDRPAWRKTDWRWQDDAVVVTEEGRRQAVCPDSLHAPSR